MLTIISVLDVIAFIDRLTLALLVKPLKADLTIKDLQLGLLFGTAFAFVFGGLGLETGPPGPLRVRVRAASPILFMMFVPLEGSIGD
jgi:hypothetical protein